MARGEVVLVVSYRICCIWFSFWSFRLFRWFRFVSVSVVSFRLFRWCRFACFGGVVSLVSVVSFCLFRWFRFVCFDGFVSFVSVVSFRLFRGFRFARFVSLFRVLVHAHLESTITHRHRERIIQLFCFITLPVVQNLSKSFSQKLQDATLKCRKALQRFLLLSKGNSFCILFNTTICWLTFLHIFAMWFSIFNLSSIVARRSSIVLDMGTCDSSHLNTNSVPLFFSQHHCLVFWTVPRHSILRKPFISTIKNIVNGRSARQFLSERSLLPFSSFANN